MYDHDSALEWRELSDADREREYSPSSMVGGDITEFLQAYAERSEQARRACQELGCDVTEVRYGPESTQTIDVAVPRARDPVPLIVFIHGGYWQQLSKVESFFGASGAVGRGMAYAAVDYTLAPHATLDEIVAECRSAVATLLAQASELGIDPERVVVTGSSAGGHLAAMVGLQGGVAGVALVSGVFELEPLIGTTINNAVGLDLEAAHRNSPLRCDLAKVPATVIVYGDNETEQFKRQSAVMAAALADHGVPVSLFEVDGKNHFDVILDVCDDSTALGRSVLALAGG